MRSTSLLKRLALLPVTLVFVATVTFTSPQKAEAATMLEYALLAALIATLYNNVTYGEAPPLELLLGESCNPRLSNLSNWITGYQESNPALAAAYRGYFSDLFNQATDAMRECISGYAPCPHGCDFNRDGVCNLWDIRLADRIADGLVLPEEWMLCNPTRTHEFDRNRDGSLTAADFRIFMIGYRDPSQCDENSDFDGDGICSYRDAFAIYHGLLRHYVDVSLDPAIIVYQE